MLTGIVSKIIVFQLNNQYYATDIQQIRSIERLQNVVEIPQTADYLKGVMNLRGVVTPIIDLRVRLGMKEAPHDEQTRVLVTQIDNLDIGLIVDAATDVKNVDATMIENTPPMISHKKYLRGVVKFEEQLLFLLDLDELLSEHELSEVKEAIER